MLFLACVFAGTHGRICDAAQSSYVLAADDCPSAALRTGDRTTNVLMWNVGHAADTTTVWRFVVTGDGRGSSGANQINTNVMSEIAQATVSEGADALLFVGDLVYSGNLAAFQQWTNVMAPVYQAGIGVYPVRGNHDLGSGWTNTFAQYLPANGPSGEVFYTYAATNRSALFVALDQYITPSRINQAWLDALLASNRLPHIFAFGHMPAFKVTHADCLDDYPNERDAFWNALSNAGARVYFCGHDHFYDHARLDDGDGNPNNDLHQMIVGTAGAPLYAAGPYDGANSIWTPVGQFHEAQYGYVLGEVDGPNVTLTWKHRTAPGVYEASETFAYAVPLPGKPGNPNPADGATNVPRHVVLSWTNGGLTTSCDLYFGTNASALVFQTNLDTTAWAAGTQPRGAIRFWRVDARHAAGVTTGGVWRFTVDAGVGVLWNGLDAGGGWTWLDWFGYFAEMDPWIYHLHHGWMCSVGRDTASIWLYTFDLGWLWTSREVYPWLWRHQDSAWLYYWRDSSAPRWFFNWSTLTWEPH
jgi:hypothetical protein